MPRLEGLEHWYDEVVVNETFARMMHWGGDVVGCMVNTMGVNVKVVGLLKDFQMGGFYEQPAPYIGFAKTSFGGNLFFKLKEPFGDNLLKLQQATVNAYPDKTIDIYSMQSEADRLYNPVRVLRNAMMVAALVMFLVMLMGLLGYTADEVQRRSKEIAIRKVNGAEASGILELLGRDILWVAVPAVAVGVCAAAYVNGLWMEMFSGRVCGGLRQRAVDGDVLRPRLGRLGGVCARGHRQPAGHPGLRLVAYVAHCQRESRHQPEERMMPCGRTLFHRR